MKKIFLKISDYLNRKSNFISWLFLILAVEYLFFFSLETILPGFVTAVFNLNFLLFITLVLWLILALVIRKNNQTFNIKNWLFLLILGGLVFSIFVSLVFVLYKTNYWEFLIYLIVFLIAGRSFYSYFLKEINHP